MIYLLLFILFVFIGLIIYFLVEQDEAINELNQQVLLLSQNVIETILELKELENDKRTV